MSVPEFPEFKPVGPEAGPLLRECIRAFPSEACEVNFTNIFIWRRFERTRYTFINGNCCILCEPPNEPAYFLPPVGNRDLEATVQKCLAYVPRLSRVPEDFVRSACAGLRSEPDRDNFDYVYQTRDLIELHGKKYDGKRNRIRKYERICASKYLRLGPEHLDGCRRLFEEWFEAKAGSDGNIFAEKEAILEALADFEALGLTGGAIECGGRVEAFSLGEPLTADTAVVHIEIADPKFPGLAQLMNREFVKNAWSGFAFVNREQDMGIPGLRRAKLSYYPHHLVQKYNVTR
jgi:uncharacterized protein